MKHYLVKHSARGFYDLGEFIEAVGERDDWSAAVCEGMKLEYDLHRERHNGRLIMFGVYQAPVVDQASFEAVLKQRGELA